MILVNHFLDGGTKIIESKQWKKYPNTRKNHQSLRSM